MDEFKNKHIVVVGVSRDATKYGHRIYRDLSLSGYDVAGIHPDGGNLYGNKIYPRLQDLPFVPDWVITVVKPEITVQIVDVCGALGVKNIWMQPGSESEEAIRKAESLNIRIVARACFMKTNKIW